MANDQKTDSAEAAAPGEGLGQSWRATQDRDDPLGADAFLVGGDQPEEAITEEERKRREAALDAHMRAQDEEDAAEQEAAGKSAGKKAGPDAGAKDDKRTKTSDLLKRMGVQEHENFFHVTAKTRDDSDPTPHISDKQLRAILLAAVHEKNWDTIYFYKGRAALDPKLTSRAIVMLHNLQKPGQPLEGTTLHVSQKRMREVEPWNEGRHLYTLVRDLGNKKNDAVAAIGNGISSTWSSVVTGALPTAMAGLSAAAGAVQSVGSVVRWGSGALGGLFTRQAAADAPGAAAPAAETGAEIPATETERRPRSGMPGGAPI